MAIRTFRVENQKGLRLATWDGVPRVMIIAGPNGVGKSTLLAALHRRQGTVEFDDPGTKILYQPPHRAIRRQQVRRRFLMGQARSLLETLAANDVTGFDGLSIPFPTRAPDNVDEAGSTVKFTLGQLENRRQAMLAQRVDHLAATGAPLETHNLPNVYGPLIELTRTLLPHLTFKRLDFANEDNIRCVFERTDVVAVNDLDLDDLRGCENFGILSRESPRAP